jgi:hypothetical protein
LVSTVALKDLGISEAELYCEENRMNKKEREKKTYCLFEVNIKQTMQNSENSPSKEDSRS